MRAQIRLNPVIKRLLQILLPVIVFGGSLLAATMVGYLSNLTDFPEGDALNQVMHGSLPALLVLPDYWAHFPVWPAVETLWFLPAALTAIGLSIPSIYLAARLTPKHAAAAAGWLLLAVGLLPILIGRLVLAQNTASDPVGPWLALMLLSWLYTWVVAGVAGVFALATSQPERSAPAATV